MGVGKRRGNGRRRARHGRRAGATGTFSNAAQTDTVVTTVGGTGDTTTDTTSTDTNTDTTTDTTGSTPPAAQTVNTPPPDTSDGRQCDQNIRAGLATSCSFAADVFKAVASSYRDNTEIPASVSATSSVTGQTYSLNCQVDASNVVECRATSGDPPALVTFPQWAAQVYYSH